MNQTDGMRASSFRIGPGGLRAVLLTAAFALAPIAPAAAADDMFLLLDQIEGESADARHRGEIELLSFKLPMKPIPAKTAGTASDGSSCPSVTFTKYADSASVRIFKMMMSGRHIEKAVITFRKPGQPPFEYLRVTLNTILVTEFEQSNSRVNFPEPAPPRAVEKVTLRSNRVTLEYFVQGASGRTERQATHWDCAKRQSL